MQRSGSSRLKKITKPRGGKARQRGAGVGSLQGSITRSLIEASFHPLTIINSDGIILDVNAATETASGYTRAELVGTNFPDHFTDPERARAGCRRLFDEGKLLDYALGFRRRDGHITSILYQGSVHRDEAGRAIGVLALVQSVADRSWVENALQSAKEYADNLIQTANALVVVLDAEGNVRVFNEAAEKITGYTREELQGRSWFDVMVPKDRYPEVWGIFQRLKGGALPKNFENPILTKSGEERYIVWQNNEVREHERIVGSVSFGIDITERKRMEEELRLSEEMYRTIAENTSDIIYRVDAAGRVTYLNPQISRYGYTADMVSHYMTELVHPDDRERVVREFRSAMATGGEFVSQFRAEDARGGTLWMDAKGQVLRDESGTVFGAIGILRDITQHKQAEIELQKLALVVRNSSEFVNLADLDGRMVFINEAGTRMVGVPPEKVGQYFIYDVVSDASQGIVRKEVVPAIMEGKGWEGDLQYRHVGTGKLTDVHAMTFLIKDPRTGKPLYLANVSRDITEHRKVVLALRESEEKFSKAFRASPAMITIRRLEDDRYIDVNQAFERRLGYSRDEVIGRTPVEVGHFANPRELEDLIKRLRDEGRYRDLEVHYRTKAGELRTALLSAELVEFSGERCALTVAEDVTERKRAEDALRKSERKYRMLYQSMLDGFVNVDMNGKINEFNEAFRLMIGYEPDEIYRMTDDDLTPEKWHAFEAEIIETQVLMRGYSDIYRKEYQRKDGTIFPVELRRYLIWDEAGKPVGVWALVRDITERVQAEELRIANRAADAASRAKSLFLANMSHEIRTPMNAILGFSQLMRRDPALTPGQKRHLDAINRSGAHLLELLNDVLEMSRIEAGRVSLNRAPFDLPALLGDLEMMFRLRAQVKNVQLTVERIGDVPRFVNTDEGKLRQVLINILGNAVNFTEKGEIVLRVRSQRHDAEGLRLFFEVEDTGPGIAAEEMGRLFRYFEQTRSGRGREAGTGLGLAISREYVRLFGGDISVTSEVGRGSVFRFDIAAGAVDAGTLAKTAPLRVARLRPGQEQFRALIADDVEDNREALFQILVSVGFQVRQVANGEEAVKEFAVWRPHVILMDLRMPDMDGAEAIRRIRAGNGGSETKIIAVTASALEERRREVLAIGADDFIRKPFREEEIFGTIQRLVGAEYLYEGQAHGGAPDRPAAGEPPPDSLDGLSADLVAQMREATMDGRLERLLELIDQIAAQAPDAANRLREMANDFQYDRLLDLFRKAG